ncbi:MAG TPA: NAD(P)/FAD-dependent oxidoreductase [Vicinamibacterales bacterium]|nr:NAD(P)/FAD-dependent oxidoreductase [Vicinamibacterales bacterium]
MPTEDVIIIGGGHNGLVAAAVLAKTGLRPLVLERAEKVGGCAVTSELAPGFRCPTLAHRAALDPSIVRALDLERHGLQIIRPAAIVCAPTAGDRALTLWMDTERTTREIEPFSRADARRYPEFLASLTAVSSVLRSAFSFQPPSLDRPRLGHIVNLLKLGRRFRGLPAPDAHRLLRWLSMSVGDLVHEWFESEPLVATIAAGGLLGQHLGPRSPGSAAAFLWLGAGEDRPVVPGWSAVGGIGVVSDALGAAATQAGARIRLCAEVRSIVVENDTATGVVLSTGEQITAQRIVSNLDPRRTLLGLVGPGHLPAHVSENLRHIRMRGTLAKINYAVSSLPAFRGLAARDPAQQEAALSGCVRLCHGIDALERAFDAAKYGRSSDEPWIELNIPSLLDRSLAPHGHHVVSAYVQFAPYVLRGSTWDTERDRFGDAATRTIEQFAPGFARSIVARQIITPLDLERDHGLTEGQIFQGELALDQLFLARPLLGWAQYGTPIRSLYLCGVGTHPGAGLDGRSGWLAAQSIAP